MYLLCYLTFLDCLADEKHYPLSTADEYFIALEPDEQYTLIPCGDTVLFDNGLFVEALSRLPAQEREMLCLSFFNACRSMKSADESRLAALAPFTAEYPIPTAGVRYYLCRGRTCASPVETIEELEKLL